MDVDIEAPPGFGSRPARWAGRERQCWNPSRQDRVSRRGSAAGGGRGAPRALATGPVVPGSGINSCRPSAAALHVQATPAPEHWNHAARSTTMPWRPAGSADAGPGRACSVSVVLAGSGALLLAFAIYDLLHTTILLQRAGPLTRWLGARLARLGRGLAARTDDRKLLSALGVGVLLATIATWGCLILIACTLLFSADPGLVVDADSGEPAGPVERLYFVGFTLITLGIGDFRPSGAVARLATIAGSGGGFFFVTLVITYLAPLVSAVTANRALAASIDALGGTPAAMLQRCLEDDGHLAFDHHLRELSGRLSTAAEQHAAYPALELFHARQRGSSLAPMAAAMWETLVLLEHAVAPARRPSAVTLAAARRSLDALLRAVAAGRLTHTRAEQPAPPPDPDAVPAAFRLADATERVTRALHLQPDLPRILHAWVREDGWRWTDVRHDGGG
ncbi:potassium channel family protein [Luteimonas sp. RD2P54]|uniref:Potassium channel family protein n=1 Tax=Luteimonas endophytica TaxID=3042023 RepID=A0ABT6J8F3_9GAMM|nr:potassium channel family protein [Luteimonas endophytica]MDH5823107.1 potassium channel family protein [Luteimonas endophytica]